MRKILCWLFGHRWHLDEGMIEGGLGLARGWHCRCGAISRHWPFADSWDVSGMGRGSCGRLILLPATGLDRMRRELEDRMALEASGPQR